MLNIISRSIVSTHTRGPRKVALNLIKGLEEAGYPYTINAALEATDTIWIHDDKAALEAALRLPGAPAIIAGPNIYTLPKEVPQAAREKNTLFVHPSLWVQNFWETFDAQKLASAVWPVGIDTKTFSPSNLPTRDLVLVYNKQRPLSDVEAVCNVLTALGERFAVLTYGKYQEPEYQTLLREAKAVVWVGRSESQGIGLQEALSMNVPMLVWDIEKLGDFVGAEQSVFSEAQRAFTPATAVPYFDKRCGMRFSQKVDLAPTLATFLDSLSAFTPRAYIESELSLNKQALALIDLYKTHFNTSEAELKSTTVRTQKKWKNGTFLFKYHTRLKDAIRQIIR